MNYLKMASQNGNPPRGASQATILGKIEHLVAESRTNPISRGQSPSAPHHIQGAGESRSLSSYSRQTPKAPSRIALYDKFPLMTGSIQNLGESEGLLASRHNDVPGDDEPHSQSQRVPLKVQDAEENWTSIPPRDQTPRGPRNSVFNDHLPLRPRKTTKVGQDQDTTTGQNGNPSVSRQTTRSQNWQSRREQDSSANRQKKGRQDQNSNSNRNQNSKSRQNQHPAGKSIPGKKNFKAGTHDDWRHEDAINDEDLARWYE